MVKLSKFNPSLPAPLLAEVNAKGEEIKSGKLVVFGGPLKDQGGAVKVPAGKAMTDAEILSAYGPDAIETLTGPAGFGFGEDPFGFHTGAREIMAWYDADPARQQVDAEMDAKMDQLVAAHRQTAVK